MTGRGTRPNSGGRPGGPDGRRRAWRRSFRGRCGVAWHLGDDRDLTRGPSCRSTRPREPVAQLVEHETFNLGAVGSSPTGLTMCPKGSGDRPLPDRPPAFACENRQSPRGTGLWGSGLWGSGLRGTGLRGTGLWQIRSRSASWFGLTGLSAAARSRDSSYWAAPIHDARGPDLRARRSSPDAQALARRKRE